MSQREIEISGLPRSAQIRNALAAQAGLDRGGAPSVHDGGSSLVFRFVTCVDQLARNPRTANLVFLAKLSSCARSDQHHSRMAINEVFGQCCNVPEASQVYEITFPGRMNQFGSRGR